MVDRPRLTPQPGGGGGGSGIPTIPRTQSVDFRSLPTVRPTGLEAEARALNVKAQMLGALQQEFQITAQEGIAQIKAEQQIEAEKHYSQGRLAIEEQLAQLDLNPEAADGDLTSASLGAYDSIAGEVIETAKSPFQRRLLEQKFNQGRLPVGQRAIRNQAMREVAEREQDFAAKLNTNQQLISASPETYEATLEEQLQSIIDMPIPDNEKQAIATETMEAFGASRIKGLVKQNPEAAEVVLQDEVFTQTLSDTLVAAAREDVALAKKKEEAEAEISSTAARAQNFLAAEEAAAQGALLNTEIADLVDAGEVTPEQGVSLVEQVQEADVKAEQEFMDTKQVLDAINGQDILTGGDSRKINTAYKKTIAPALASMDPQESLKNKLRFVSQTNKIPSLMENEIKAQLKGGSASQRLDAAKLLRGIQEQSPIASVASELTETEHARADRYMDLIEAGIPEEDVIETIDRQDSMTNQNTSEIRSKEFKTLFDKSDAISRATNQFDGFFTREPGLSVETGTETRLVEDMQALAESYYRDNPDIERAMEYASKNIERTYGVTKTGGGGKRLMKYAPENFYAVNGNTRWLEDQLEAEIQQISGNETVKRNDIFLVPDSRTAREASKNTPSYQVVIRNEDGTLRSVAGRWQPDSTEIAKKEKARIKEAGQKKLEKVRKMASRKKAFRKAMTDSDPLLSRLDD